MNPKPISETEAIRSDIEMTRRRMDDTMNALGERMHGRHILDEVIGFFRSNSDKTSEAGTKVREKLSATADKVSDSASNAANAVVDTVKKNPLPILMITAGAAWLTYSMTRSRRFETEEDDSDESNRYDPDTHYDRPLAYPGSTSAEFGGQAGDMAQEGESKFGEMTQSLKDKASSAKDQVKEKLSNLGDQARDKFQSVKARASEMGERVQDRTREVYQKSRDRVVQTADEYPVELGLGCLAVGVLVGLALPTPQPVHRLAGPTVDRLRNRTRDASRDMLQKGKRVVQAATDAAKQEAESQGLSVERLRNSGAAIGKRAEDAASNAMAEEADAGGACDVEPNKTRTEPADPSAARPAM